MQRVDLLDLGQDVEELLRDLLAAGEAPIARRPPRSWRRRARSAPAPGRPSCVGPRAAGAPRHRSAAGRSPPGRSGCRWRPPPACLPRSAHHVARGRSTSSSRSGPLAPSGAVAITQPARQPSRPADDPPGSVTVLRPRGSEQAGVVDPVRGRQGHGPPDQLLGLGAGQHRRVAVEERVAAAAVRAGRRSAGPVRARRHDRAAPSRSPPWPRPRATRRWPPGRPRRGRAAARVRASRSRGRSTTPRRRASACACRRRSSRRRSRARGAASRPWPPASASCSSSRARRGTATRPSASRRGPSSSLIPSASSAKHTELAKQE